MTTTEKQYKRATWLGESPDSDIDEVERKRKINQARALFKVFVRENFCFIRDQLYIKSVHTDEWADYRKTDLKHLAMQMYGKQLSEYHSFLLQECAITIPKNKEPDQYLWSVVWREFESAIYIKQSIVWHPGQDLYCEYDGRERLNTYDDLILREVTEADLDDKALGDVLGLFSQLGGHHPSDGLEKVFDGVSTSAWIAQWLAFAYQNPEIRCNTMLWLISKSRGVGKGTLLYLMRRVFGHRHVGKVTSQELESEFNPSLFGRLFVEFDEGDAYNKVTTARKFDAILGNEHLTIRNLYMQAYITPNVLRIISTTNVMAPIVLSKDDRRHTLIRTREGPEAKEWALDFWLRLEGNADYHDACILAMAWLLDTIQVDVSWVGKPLDTPLRMALMSEGTLIERWFAASSSTWQIGNTQRTSQMWDSFKNYCLEANEKSPPKAWFVRHVLNDLEDWIEKRDTNAARGYTKIADHRLAPSVKQSEKLVDMRKHLKKNNTEVISMYELDEGVNDVCFNDR
jgi:hypothetical protein